MVRLSCDAGSLPFVGDFGKFSEGAGKYGLGVSESTELFENKVVEGFLDKVETGIDVPNYPQYRDMNQMFLDVIEGLGKVNGGYVEIGPLTLRKEKGVIPEAQALRNRSPEIYEKLSRPFELRMCITGPYTLSSFFAYKDKGTFTRLGDVLTQIIDTSVFHSKQGSVRLVSVDEPVFGFVDDPLLDRGSDGRESLLKAWETIMQKTRAKGATTCLHLHNTSDELFWQLRSLNLIESHVDDSLYQARRTKELLESTDKFLKASIAITDFDQLIRNHLMTTSKQPLNEISINEKIAETWKKLGDENVDPTTFVENIELMKKRLSKLIETFGAERILYAGPECGTLGFPQYKTALECLRRVAQAVKDVAKQ